MTQSRKECGINAIGIYTCKAKFNEFRLCLALAAPALRCVTSLSEGGSYVGRRLGAAARCLHIFRRERGDWCRRTKWYENKKRREQAPALREKFSTKKIFRPEAGINAHGIYTCKAKFNEFRLCLALAAPALRDAASIIHYSFVMCQGCPVGEEAVDALLGQGVVDHAL